MASYPFFLKGGEVSVPCLPPTISHTSCPTGDNQDLEQLHSKRNTKLLALLSLHYTLASNWATKFSEDQRDVSILHVFSLPSPKLMWHFIQSRCLSICEIVFLVTSQANVAQNEMLSISCFIRQKSCLNKSQWLST